MSSKERERIDELANDLTIVRVDVPSSIPAVLAALRSLLATDSAMIWCPVHREHGWELERIDHDSFAAANALAERAQRFLSEAPRRYAWYDPVRPEPEQRNVVIEAISRIPTGELEASSIYREFLYPLRLHRHRQLRALVCDGPILLGWFGAFHDGVVEPRQFELLRRLVGPMRDRLVLERRLAGSTLASAALAAALDQLASPAFVIDRRASIHASNQSGRLLLAADPRDLRRGLHAAIAGDRSRFQMVELHEHGVPDHFLATVRVDDADERIRASVVAAGARWRLTPRQVEILGHVARGLANISIAALLGITTRAVELHVTAILERAGVENRAALISLVLTR